LPGNVCNTQAYAAAVNAAQLCGYTDRLPNKKELESIVETCGYSPAINQTVFPDTPAAAFWSSTSLVSPGYSPAPQSALFVAFSDGKTEAFQKTGNLYARLVRGGQASDSFDASRAMKLTLDVDDNGAADALTDGLLVIRYLFGLRGTALTQGALGVGAKRTIATDIGTYLQGLTPQ